jgi:hypothetical protein
MQRLDGAIRDLCEEFARSVQCHGMWDNYTADDVFRAVSGEFREYAQAYGRQDRHGDHGELAELLQVACVALKGFILLGGTVDKVEDEE